MIFGDYSRYYNLLYRDKDYAGEARYIQRMLERFAPATGKRLLELGCGTGNHAFLLAEQGYDVHGVDRSPDMIAEAAGRAQRDDVTGVQFSEGDVCSVGLGQTFDAVLSLFHVVSYQTENDAVSSMFSVARQHLEVGGIFLFDVWYGPAVLTDRPAVRIKRLSDETTQVIRLAEPELFPNQNAVDVNYEVIVKDSGSDRVDTIKETHRMRYYFEPELRLLLKQAGFSERVCSEEWMTGREPGFDTWGVVFVAEAV